jgi:peptide/nickel transport system substrate-binding protein
MESSRQNGRGRPKAPRLTFLLIVLAVGLVVAVSGIVSMSSASPNKDAKTAAGGTFVLANLTDPDPIDPALTSHTMSRTLERNVYESLLYYKLGTTQLVPVLATSWKVSPDSRQYTFQLRQGVKFQNGATFTSADVKATFDRDLALPAGVAGSYLTDLKSVTVLGPYSVRLTLKKPYVFFAGIMPKIGIASAADIEAHKGSDNAQSWFKDNANGTGPWMLKSYVRGTQYTLVRNPNYWRPFRAGAFDQIIVRPISDSATASQLICKGEVNMGSWMSFRDMVRASKCANNQLLVFPSAMTMLLQLNGGRAPLNNLKVRQAIQAAFPYDQFRAFYLNYAQRTGSALSPNYPGSLHLPPLRQDLGKARQLLAAAGFKNGGGIKLRYVAVQGLEDERQAGLLLQGALKKIGVKLTVEVLPFATFFAQGQKTATAPDISPAPDSPETNDPFQWFAKLFSRTGFLNFSHFNVRALDRIILKAQATKSASVRLNLLHSAQRMIANNVFAIPAANMKVPYNAPKWLGGFVHDTTDLQYDPKFFGTYRKG